MKIFSSRSMRTMAVFTLCCGQLAAIRAATTDNTSPEVSISLRGLVNGELEAGEPFRVAVRIDAPESATANLILAPAKGSWIETTTVEILSADENPIPAASQPVTGVTAEASTAIDADKPAHGLWWFPAENLTSVTSGDYLVRARLTIRDGAGWKGEAVSEPASLRVVAPSADPERVTQRQLERARAAILADDPAKSAEILNALLEADPDCIPALALHAALSLEGGNRNAAQVCISRALALSNKRGREPSAELHELATRIDRPLTAGATGAVAPAWTQVPRSVFAAVRMASGMIPGLGVESRTGDASGRHAIAPPQTAAAPAPVIAPATIPVPAPKVQDSSVAIANPPAPVSPGAKSLGVVVATAELVDAKIRADANGQWAASATAGSQYGRTQYSAARATGAPNINVQGNSPDAWCPAVRDKGTDWLEVTFAKPVQALEVRVRQNDAAGAIAKVEAIEENGTSHIWWEGADPYQAPSVKEIVWFAVRVPKTSYLVARVKLTLNLASGPGYKEIDAVQLVGGE